LGEAIELDSARPYCERAEREEAWHDRAANWFLGNLLQPLREAVHDPGLLLARIVSLTELHEAALQVLSDRQLRARARSMRVRLRRRGFTPELAGEAFALVREAASRTLGRRHYETQLMAGWGLLQGHLVEMATGEGKTFAATLPACTVALAGYPVHVITVNDYLAARDAEEMQPLYAFLGLDVGVVIQGRTPSERRAAYACAITYCTNKELAFDYLRDRVAVAQRSSQLHLALDRLRGLAETRDSLVLRGLHFAIVDEADSVFIDEARTPLILSAPSPVREDAQRCQQALELAQQLKPGEHYVLEMAERRVVLRDAGRDYLQDIVENGWYGSVSAREREEWVSQALTALHLFHRDQHYVVVSDKIQIVDELTGRVMPDRSWERGLQQLIESKEGCPLSDRRETLARITYQRLFRRYVHLAGMSGTGREVAREVQTIYRLPVVRVPLYRPSQRVDHGVYVVADQRTKWECVADTVVQLTSQERRPVLIGTRSVQASEQLSEVLSQRGIAHALLNAKQDRMEAEVIARAGQAGQVTVATNMAGRGTDIRLGPGVAARGGLHVILTEYHESRRIDRQLYGRCGRQGDPGSCEAILALDDELFRLYAATFAAWSRGLIASRGRLAGWWPWLLRRVTQAKAERHNRAVRMQNLKRDWQLDKLLAFSGRSE